MTPGKESLTTPPHLNNVFKTLLMEKPSLPRELRILQDIDKTLLMNMKDGERSLKYSINSSQNSRQNKKQSVRSSTFAHP